MKPRSGPLFLARRSYRVRRLTDGARLMPFGAAILFMLPLLWGHRGPDQGGTALAMQYVFAIWGLVAFLAFLGIRLLAYFGAATDAENPDPLGLEHVIDPTAPGLAREGVRDGSGGAAMSPTARSMPGIDQGRDPNNGFQNNGLDDDV